MLSLNWSRRCWYEFLHPGLRLNFFQYSDFLHDVELYNLHIIHIHFRGPAKIFRVCRFVELYNFKYMWEIWNLTGPLEICQIIRFVELCDVDLYDFHCRSKISLLVYCWNLKPKCPVISEIQAISKVLTDDWWPMAASSYYNPLAYV